MVNFCTVCGCCTRTNIVREHLDDALRICDVSAMGLLYVSGYRDGGGGGGGGGLSVKAAQETILSPSGKGGL